MQVGPLVMSIAAVAIAAVFMKCGLLMSSSLLLVYGFYKASKVFNDPKPPFEHW